MTRNYGKQAQENESKGIATKEDFRFLILVIKLHLRLGKIT